MRYHKINSQLFQSIPTVNIEFWGIFYISCLTFPSLLHNFLVSFISNFCWSCFFYCSSTLHDSATRVAIEVLNILSWLSRRCLISGLWSHSWHHASFQNSYFYELLKWEAEIIIIIKLKAHFAQKIFGKKRSKNIWKSTTKKFLKNNGQKLFG